MTLRNVLAALRPVFLLGTIACGGSSGTGQSWDGPRATADAALETTDVGPTATDVAPASTDAAATDDGGAADALGGCSVTIEMHALLASPHVADGTAVTYNSNPPSSGPHCGAWARWGVYDEPLSRCNYVHDLEHGAIVVTYDNRLSSLSPQTLEAVVRAFKDPRCTGKARVVLTPDQLLPPGTAVAASAWGYTFRARCFDAAAQSALTAFMNEHAGKAPEDFCDDGSVGSPR